MGCRRVRLIAGGHARTLPARLLHNLVAVTSRGFAQEALNISSKSLDQESRIKVDLLQRRRKALPTVHKLYVFLIRRAHPPGGKPLNFNLGSALVHVRRQRFISFLSRAVKSHILTAALSPRAWPPDGLCARCQVQRICRPRPAAGPVLSLPEGRDLKDTPVCARNSTKACLSHVVSQPAVERLPPPCWVVSKRHTALELLLAFPAHPSSQC